MKRPSFISAIILLSLVVLVLHSCRVEEDLPADVPAEEALEPFDPFDVSWESRVSLQEGILKFEQAEDLWISATNLAIRNPQETFSWSEKMGFVSQYELYYRTLDAQEAAENEFYEPYKHLTEEEFMKLDLPRPEKTPEYQYLLDKGLIAVEEDSKEAHTYTLNLADASLATVVNEEGFVMAGETLYHISASSIKSWEGGNISQKALLLRTLESDPEKGITVVDMNAAARAITYDWSRDVNSSGSPNGTWDEYNFGFLKTPKRLRYGLYGKSYTTLSGYSTFYVCGSAFTPFAYFGQQVTFQIKFQAQNRKWGNWAFRNSFKPTFDFNGSTWSTTPVYIQVDRDLNCNYDTYYYNINSNNSGTGFYSGGATIYNVNNWTSNLRCHNFQVDVSDTDPTSIHMITGGVDASFTFNVSADGRTLPSYTR